MAAQPSPPDSRASRAAGARAAAPLAVAVGLFGVSFGVLARAEGMGRLAPVVMSATTFAGSAQFAAVSILGAGGGVVSAVVAAALLNARYAPIGLTVAPFHNGPRWRRLLTAQLVVDESWVIGQTGTGRYDLDRIVGAGALLYLAWVVGTVAGVFGGGLLSDPTALGIDAAFPALFLGLLAPQLRRRPAAVTAAAGAAIALALTPLTRPGIPVVAAGLGVVAGLGRRDRGA
jgi:4-azaleucine resistance transporter AzlC